MGQSAKADFVMFQRRIHSLVWMPADSRTSFREDTHPCADEGRTSAPVHTDSP
jgi:hypothetical protein